MKLLALLLALGLGFSANAGGLSHLNQGPDRSAMPRSATSEVDTVLYAGNIGDLETGLTADDIYHATMVAPETANNDVTTVSHDGQTMIKGDITNTGTILYLGTGQDGKGAGQGGFNFVAGQHYRFKIHIELSIEDDSDLYFAPYFNWWTALRLYNDGRIEHASNMDLPNIINPSYINNELAFDVYYPGGDRYVQIAFEGTLNNSFYYLGDFEVIHLDTVVLEQDTSMFPVNDSMNDNQWRYFYNAGFDHNVITSSGNETYARLYCDTVKTDNWPILYFHHLTANYHENLHFNDGEEYKVTIGFHHLNATAFYVHFADANGVTLNIENGVMSVCSGWEDFFHDYSFQDNVLQFTVTPNSAIHVIPDDSIIRLTFYSNAAAVDVGISYLLIENNKVVKAKDYASYLLNQTAVCDATGAQNNITSIIWSDLSDKFDALGTAKAEMSDKSPDENAADIRLRAMARYKYIIEKYGLDDFMNKGYSQLARVLFKFNDQNTSLCVIISIATASAMLVGLFFILRRRKER